MRNQSLRVARRLSSPNVGRSKPVVQGRDRCQITRRCACTSMAPAVSVLHLISPLRVSHASARPRTLTSGPSRLRSGFRRTTFTWTGRKNLTRDGGRAGGPEDRRDASAAACATGEGATRATSRSIRRLCRPGACADTQDPMRNAKTQCAAADRQHCGVSTLRRALGPPPSCPDTGVQSDRNPPHAVCFSGDRQVRGRTRDARASKEQSAPAVTRQSAATRGRPRASTARMNHDPHEPSLLSSSCSSSCQSVTQSSV